MEDAKIISLYLERDEQAITETDRKYGSLCARIACNILGNREDSAECVNSVYWKVWNAIPPQRPTVFSAFLGKITRNLALHQYEKNRAQKRGRGQTFLALEELGDCIPDPSSGKAIEDGELARVFDAFLGELPQETRKIFVSRYWGMTSVREIAERYSITEGKVKTVLYRTRAKLKTYLEQEGIVL